MSPGSSKVWHSRLEQAKSWWFLMEQELVALRIYSQFSQEGRSEGAPGPGTWSIKLRGGPANRFCPTRHQRLHKEQWRLCPALLAQPCRAAVPLLPWIPPGAWGDLCSSSTMPSPAASLR